MGALPWAPDPCIAAGPDVPVWQYAFNDGHRSTAAARVIDPAGRDYAPNRRVLEYHRHRGPGIARISELSHWQRTGRIRIRKGWVSAAPSDRARHRQARGGNRPAGARFGAAEGMGLCGCHLRVD